MNGGDGGSRSCLNATTELVAVMNADDLRKGLAKVAGK
jgi:hypothetical protein